MPENLNDPRSLSHSGAGWEEAGWGSQAAPEVGMQNQGRPQSAATGHIQKGVSGREQNGGPLRTFPPRRRALTWVLLPLRVLKAVSLLLSGCTERREGNLLLKKQIQVCRPRAAAAGPEQEAAA